MILPGIVTDMMLQGITLDRDSRISLRRQLVGHLELRILGGQIGPGRRLPSLRRVGEFLGLHRNTVACAYGDLVQAGLVHTRPGSGVYVSAEPGAAACGLPRVVIRGSRQLGLICRDPDLGAVLEAELRGRLAVRVRFSDKDCQPSTVLRLAPSVGFVRWVKSLKKPSIVAVISRSDRVHQLVSIAVFINGGEGVGYLPVSPADHRNLERMRRLTDNVLSDYAELPRARRFLSAHVPPLPLISGLSITAVTTLLHRLETRDYRHVAPSRATERSLQAGVQEP